MNQEMSVRVRSESGNCPSGSVTQCFSRWYVSRRTATTSRRVVASHTRSATIPSRSIVVDMRLQSPGLARQARDLAHDGRVPAARDADGGLPIRVDRWRHQVRPDMDFHYRIFVERTVGIGVWKTDADRHDWRSRLQRQARHAHTPNQEPPRIAVYRPLGKNADALASGKLRLEIGRAHV